MLENGTWDSAARLTMMALKKSGIRSGKAAQLAVDDFDAFGVTYIADLFKGQAVLICYLERFPAREFELALLRNSRLSYDDDDFL